MCDRSFGSVTPDAVTQGFANNVSHCSHFVFCCLLFCEAWKSLRLGMYPPLLGAEHPALPRRRFDDAHSVLSSLQGTSAVSQS